MQEVNNTADQIFCQITGEEIKRLTKEICKNHSVYAGASRQLKPPWERFAKHAEYAGQKSTRTQHANGNQIEWLTLEMLERL